MARVQAGGQHFPEGVVSVPFQLQLRFYLGGGLRSDAQPRFCSCKTIQVELELSRIPFYPVSAAAESHNDVDVITLGRSMSAVQ